MKREIQDVAGRPKVGRPRTDGLGQVSDGAGKGSVASFRDANPSTLGWAKHEGGLAGIREPSGDSLVEEFAEFLEGKPAALQGAAYPDANPVFRERLRRRLWRLHVMTTGGGDPSERH